MPRYKGFTHSQSLILGYLISAGGNAYAGATTKEIIDATGLSQNAAYRTLRQGIPGVVECRSKTKTGSTMYYADPEAMSQPKAEPTKDEPATIWDTEEWSEVGPGLFAGLSEIHDREPASIKRIQELINGLASLDPTDELPYCEMIAAGAQAAAMHALTMRKILNNG